MTLMDLIQAALHEDMPHGDLTTDSLGLGPRLGEARLLAKSDLILSGAEAFEQTMTVMDPSARVTWQFHDGDHVKKSNIICTINGDLMQILKAERVALNFMGHLSGIATLTGLFADQVKHTACRILDTRKTLPGYRDLEKRAVVHGGGFNHRMNLSDAILIKDNHKSISGGLKMAVERVRMHAPKKKIEVECDKLEEVDQALALHVDRILLDNMANDAMKAAVQRARTFNQSQAGRARLNPIEIEASGNMTLDRVKNVAELGVDFISVGALTHSAPSADVSLLFDWHQSVLAPI